MTVDPNKQQPRPPKSVKYKLLTNSPLITHRFNCRKHYTRDLETTHFSKVCGWGCSKVLTCQKHICREDCHRGRCKLCQEKSCNTKFAQAKCIIQPKCGHIPFKHIHNLPNTRCPPCCVFVDSYCFCGRKSVWKKKCGSLILFVHSGCCTQRDIVTLPCCCWSFVYHIRNG